MENIDIDMVIDIPDTPDRVGAHCRETGGKERVSSSSYSRNFRLIDEDRSNQLNVSEEITRHHDLHRRTNSDGECENRNGLHPSGKAPLFRRAAVEKDKGKAICTKFPSKSSASVQIDPVKNQNLQNGCKLLLEKARSHDAPKIFSSSGVRSSLKIAGNVDKGKEKLEGNTNKETIDLSSPPPCKKEDHQSSFDRPILRAPGHRRLVRNGCISPHGIAARAKQLAEHNQTSSMDNVSEQNCTWKAACSHPSPIDIRDIVMEDDVFDRAKGKGAISHPLMSKDNETQIPDVRSRVGHRETSGSGGWRSTHNRHTRVGHPFPDRNNPPLRMSARTTSSIYPETEQKSELSQVDRMAIKRQRSNGFASAASDEPGVSLFGSSAESSSSRPSAVQNHQIRGMQNPVFKINDSSPEVTLGGIEGTRSVDNDESESRARQLEADEMLARELQEQLYQHAAIFEDGEIDENIAWALQQEENSLRASSSQNHRSLHPRSSIQSSRRQTRSQLQQNVSNRRANVPRANSSVRVTRSRGNLGRSPAGIPGNWNFHFPNDMALELRLDMLEELEAFVELSGSVNETSRLLQFDGDFNEQDYEMLLALDEDNHRHAGASLNQVNSLPQSTVQTDNFEEACAICLETPAKGDVIRHLPCLHKFHKDCIDPWLGRSKSCPVCKSSMT